MTTLYLVSLAAGTAALVAMLIRALRRAALRLPPWGVRLPPGEEFTIAGARVDPSDEYAVEGGAGGAEGDAGTVGYDDGADGGVGGAEGGAAGLRVHRPLQVLAPTLAAFFAGFGGGGCLASSGGWSGLRALLVAFAGGLVLSAIVALLTSHALASGDDRAAV